jgi:hypothetical protein
MPVANKYCQYIWYLFYSDKTQSDPWAYPSITFWVIENKGELGIPVQNPEHA